MTRLFLLLILLGLAACAGSLAPQVSVSEPQVVKYCHSAAPVGATGVLEFFWPCDDLAGDSQEKFGA